MQKTDIFSVQDDMKEHKSEKKITLKRPSDGPKEFLFSFFSLGKKSPRF